MLLPFTQASTPGIPNCTVCTAYRNSLTCMCSVARFERQCNSEDSLPPPNRFACCLHALGCAGKRDLALGVLRKTESLEAHGRHGNPFSDDGSTERRHDKSPLLIGSADSSYALDTPRR